MKTFKEYYTIKEEEKLDEEMMNEEVTSIIISTLAFPSVFVMMAWASSVILTAYFRKMSGIIGKIIRNWRELFKEIHSIITKEVVEDTLNNLKNDPKVQQENSRSERNKRAFAEELKEVYNAIERKDFETAKEELKKTPKYVQNNPDVHKVIIKEVSRVLSEPPIYVSSPGNKTYQAIKKVINIQVAKAAAYATKITLEKNVKKGPAETEEE